MKTEVASSVVGLKRLFRKIILNISTSVWIPSSKRWYLLLLGGVKIEGSCFIGPRISVDTIRPDLIEMGH